MAARLPMGINVLQVNVNRSRRALDLLLHQAKELDAGILIVSEPCNIMPSDKWMISLDGGSAIYFDPNLIKLKCRLLSRGDRFVAAQCGPYLFISAVTNQRGLQVVRWAAERDLRIVNVGDTPTCVRPQGSSIVDLTWSSPDLLPLIGNWQVNEDKEWLSDHVCISFNICKDRPSLPPIRGLNRRWNLRKFDRDFFKATLIWGSRNPETEDEHDLSQSIRDLDRIMEEACDAAASRISPRRPRRCAYWWNESVAILRNACIRARRSWQ
ncbi:reverse transcriptase [Lasius niger]|uniref:Reverse transcriptase n=1 Tax=Lasius niger TaxID=67767 RepID=A0A0J7KI80_LASNI|nr:reverse transcriptase [Lasius niger]